MSSYLDGLGIKFKTDKSTKGRKRPGLGYIFVYEKYLESYRDMPIDLLEIGVQRGGSIRMWKEWFHPRSNISGIDIDPIWEKNMPTGAYFFQGDQGDSVFLKKVAKDKGPWDIVIDDGCHDMVPLITSYTVLWEYLKPGGFYIVEDLGTSYQEEHGGGLKKPGTFVEFIKDKLDFVVSGGPSDIESMHFHKQIVFIKKKKSPHDSGLS